MLIDMAVCTVAVGNQHSFDESALCRLRVPLPNFETVYLFKIPYRTLCRALSKGGYKSEIYRSYSCCQNVCHGEMVLQASAKPIAVMGFAAVFRSYELCEVICTFV